VTAEVTISADIAVIGGGLGGIAAAIAAADLGASVILTVEEPMIGGQITAQLTSPLDEHPLVESAGVTATYRRFRDGVRAASGGLDNPGEGWVSRLCFEPLAGLRVLEGMLEQHLRSGRIRLLALTRPVGVLDGDDQPVPRHFTGRIGSVLLLAADGTRTALRAEVYIDATELGDLLPLSGCAWVVGSEGSDAFGETDAVAGRADPRAEQSCTWVAALVREREAQPVGDPPPRYEELRDSQPFSLTLDGERGEKHRYRFFTAGPSGLPPFWEYRRIRASRPGAQVDEAAVINWAGNDCRSVGLVADPARAHADARELTLAFVHWLRTEVPRDPDDGVGALGTGLGYPELRLAPELSGTEDGLAAAPYVRESRRLANPNPVTGLDIAEPARDLPDSVGVAWYHADLHSRVGHPESVYRPTRPFQIPASALVPAAGVGAVNLLMGAKNLAATQVAAAAYRVHPAEWAIGEAAGVLAAKSWASGVPPLRLIDDPALFESVRQALVEHGAPLDWGDWAPAAAPSPLPSHSPGPPPPPLAPSAPLASSPPPPPLSPPSASFLVRPSPRCPLLSPSAPGKRQNWAPRRANGPERPAPSPPPLPPPLPPPRLLSSRLVRPSPRCPLLSPSAPGKRQNWAPRRANGPERPGTAGALAASASARLLSSAPPASSAPRRGAHFCRPQRPGSDKTGHLDGRTARTCTARPGTARTCPARPGTARPGTERPGTARNGRPADALAPELARDTD
jgi:hypothetical protein